MENKRIGISMSTVGDDAHDRFIEDITRHVFLHVINNGGVACTGINLIDLPGIDDIVQEARDGHDANSGAVGSIENHRAWPFSLDLGNEATWLQANKDVIKAVRYGKPPIMNDVTDLDSRIEFTIGLNEMRKRYTEKNDAIVLCGGKLSGYIGRMPGLFEEFFLSLSDFSPMFLIGGLNSGFSKDSVISLICKELATNGHVKDMPEQLTYEWQVENNENYLEYLSLEKEAGLSSPTRYDMIHDAIKHTTVAELADRVGITSDEYIQLMTTDNVIECVSLIEKGLHATL